MSAPVVPPSSDAGTMTPLKRAFLALEQANARVTALEQAARAPIAVIGVGCRVPGGDDPAGFWQLMRDGEDTTGPIPGDRWDADALYDPDPDAPGRIATRRAGFLRSPIDRFDPGLFGIAPREAQGMDPQQRLLLEVSWEALENAGQAPDRLERSATGVYFGLCASDYAYLQLRTEDPELLDAHFTSGIAHSILSGRLSYLLGLQGPSLTIDTACSSSLVAVHLACQALRTGDCRMALAGGVNLILSSDLYIALSHARMLAPDGRCKTFSAAADGFARGEGCGIVVLKLLTDAQADGDRILAVIRGSAVNQDGPSGSLTAPNGPAQEAVIREALARGGVAPHEVGFIEAHGTGTELGDPLEVQALGAVFGGERDPSRPLLLGSVKTNIGHLEGAAGVIGLIKVVLALRHRQVPAHLHFDTPSPHIPWEELPFRVPTAITPWEAIAGRRIGGVSSFGFSGTNAHVVLEEAPVARSIDSTDERPAFLLTLSARDDRALAALAERHRERLMEGSRESLGDMCFTANAARAHFASRATIVAHTREELQERLAALAAGEFAEGVRAARVARRDPPRVAFLFTGQGSQYAGMARGLYDAAPAFREALDRCAALLSPHMPRPLLDVLFATDGTALDETAHTQPALFAVEYALSELLRAWGVVPDVVIGHSVGEYVAACVAGVMSLEDATRLVAARGRLMQSLPAGGAMAAIFAPESEVARALAPHLARVSIAAVNGPEQTVISGDPVGVEAICREFGARGVRCQSLPVSHAFHSPLVDPMLDAFEREVAAVHLSAPRLPLVSNLSGRVVDGAEVTKPEYWRRHVREPVRFADGLSALAALEPHVAIELGPNPTLVAFAKSALGESAPVLVPTLRKGRDDWEQLLETVASLYLAGAGMDWRAVDRGIERRIVDLPTYPFQRERYWFQAKPRPSSNGVRGRPTGHPIVGTRLRSAGAETIYESTVSADSPAFVRHHRVQERVVMPATAYLDALATVASHTLGDGARVEDVTVREAMLLDDDGASRVVQIVASPDAAGTLTVSLNSVAEASDDGEPWVAHVTAKLGPGAARCEPTAIDQVRARCTDRVTREEHYVGFERRGLSFGDGFKAVRDIWRRRDEAIGIVEIDESLARDAHAYGVHPVLLDGCLQVLAAALPDERDDALYLPIGFGSYARYGACGSRCLSHVTVQGAGAESFRADVRVLGEDGTVLAELLDVQLKRVSRDALGGLVERWLDDCLYSLAWRSAPVAVEDGRPSLVPGELAAVAARSIPALRASAGLDAHDVFLPRLEALCADYTVRALSRLGWSPVVGDRVDESELASRLGVVTRHRRLFNRLLAILAEGGWLAKDGKGWTVRRSLGTGDPAGALSRLLAEFPAGAAELEMTGRAAAEMAEALRGERDPMQLLFPGGSLATAERLYRDSPTARLYNGLMADVIAEAASRVTGRPLRILEIGAGTGGTTFHVAPRLAGRNVEYTFTDVGPLFVERARERFGAHDFMRFAVLDLERDPEAQGFEAGAFDVVIASNVIHATANLRRTLARVRRLIVPGGLLAMLEVTAPQRWFDLTVGLTDGWWAFEDADLRPDYATMPRERWLTLLGECGFDATAALPEGAGHRGSLGLQSLVLARAGAAGAREWLLFADGDGVAESLGSRLRARGDRCTMVYAGTAFSLDGDVAAIDPASPADYRRLLAERRSNGRAVHGVVYAWPVNATPWENVTANDVVLAEARGAVGATLLAQALLAEGAAPRLWLLTRAGQQVEDTDLALDPLQAPVWGLARTMLREHPEFRCVCVDLDRQAGAAETEWLTAELEQPGTESLVAFRPSGRLVARLRRSRRDARELAPRRSAPYRLAPSTQGSLDGLTPGAFVRRAPAPGEVEIAVEATGLNFKDVLNVLGMYPGDPGPLGGECAGRVTAVGDGVTHVAPDDEVLAVAGGSFASHVIARAELVHKRPDGVSAEEGASFPIAFLTAEFCLGHLAKMRAGDRVLVHAAAGGVGMAAVRLAQRAGAEVFATAGSPWKRELLRSLGVVHVFDSRSAAFADEILACTEGRGVDVVLNSLSGEPLDASFRVLARGGRFVEIGKRGIRTAEEVAALGRDHRYSIVDWGETAERDPGLIGDMFARLVKELGSGTLAPLPRHTFALDDASRAFRFMAQARHAGKIVVRHGNATSATIRRDGTYLVTGGLAGLGPVVAEWLVERGAGRVVLIGRRRVTPEVASQLQSLHGRGTVVMAESLDVTDGKGVRALLGRLRAEGPPLRGVIHSAGVLDDAGLLQQDAGRFERVFAAKVRGAWLLDSLTRGDPLDFFVLFSSIASLLGSPGQANHSAANAFLDVLARERRARGLPGLSINWGPWTDVGAAAGITDRLAGLGLGALTPEQGLRALERLLNGASAQAAVVSIDWRRFAKQEKPLAYFSELMGGSVAGAAREVETRSTTTARVSLQEQLAAAPKGRWRPMIAAFVRERALKALGVDPSRAVDPETPLGELGLDSLLAVELRNTLSTALGRSMPATLLFDYPTMDALTDHIMVDVLGLEDAPAAPNGSAAAPEPVSLVGSIEELSDEEVDRQLAARAKARV